MICDHKSIVHCMLQQGVDDHRFLMVHESDDRDDDRDEDQIADLLDEEHHEIEDEEIDDEEPDRQVDQGHQDRTND